MEEPLLPNRINGEGFVEHTHLPCLIVGMGLDTRDRTIPLLQAVAGRATRAFLISVHLFWSREHPKNMMKGVSRCLWHMFIYAQISGKQNVLMSVCIDL